VSNVTPLEAGNTPKNPAELDRISLEQALKDFEIANARVVDLTKRLVESERERQEVTSHLEELKLRLASSEAENALHSPPKAWQLGIRVARKVAGKVYGRYLK
jgi:hypothetical protein